MSSGIAKKNRIEDTCNLGEPNNPDIVTKENVANFIAIIREMISENQSSKILAEGLVRDGD